MPFDLAVIDLDNTLYAADCGVFARMDRKMTAYIAEKLGLDHESANKLRIQYWRRYGSTLRGLMIHHGLEPEPFLAYVHDVGVDTLLKPDPRLSHALECLPGRKIIHTNGTREHAVCVLKALGVQHRFEAIYDIRFNAYRPKPCSKTLADILEREGAPPHRCLVVDDSVDNLVAADRLGCTTVLVSPKANENWPRKIAAFHHLPTCFSLEESPSY